MTVYEADWVCPATAPPIPNGAIAVENGRLSRVGRAEDVIGGKRIHYPGCAIIPGFVNAHAHLEITILRGFLEDLPFMEWILRLVRAKYQALSPEAFKVSAQLGAMEMLRAGITTVAEVMDMGAGWDAMKEFGLQGVAYQEVFGPADSVAAESIKNLTIKVERHRPEESDTQRIGVSPHAPFTVSKTLYEATRDYARRERMRMTAHIAESRDEMLLVRDGAGSFAEGQRNRGIEVKGRHCTPIAYLYGMDLSGPDMLLIHAIEIEDQDLERLQSSRTPVVHCPKSNAKLGNRIARVTEMRDRGVTVSLGTDSVASNNVADMFEEMRAAIFHQRILTGHIHSLTSAMAFSMATIEGARCLGLDEQLGSLEAGKRADFAVVDLSRAATQPVYNPIDSMVYSACRSDVRSTFIGGREVDLDETEILREARAVARKLRAIV
jgi:cytosine/adenosine deaminase-related metal-dependent hydrolase